MASIKLHITNSSISTNPMGSWNNANVAIERQGRELGHVDCPKDAQTVDFKNSDFSSLQSYPKLHLHCEQLKLQ